MHKGLTLARRFSAEMIEVREKGRKAIRKAITHTGNQSHACNDSQTHTRTTVHAHAEGFGKTKMKIEREKMR